MRFYFVPVIRQMKCIRPVKPAIQAGLRVTGLEGETQMSPVERSSNRFDLPFPIAVGE